MSPNMIPPTIAPPTLARKMEPTSVPVTDPCKFDILPALRGARTLLHDNR
jgi:hypothetical protein